MRITVTTPPAVEPITLEEAKLHCRVDLDDDDTLITRLIVAARQRVEKAKKRALITQTLTLSIDDWPCGRVIEIPRPPLQSVASVTYIDAEGDEQTLDPSKYDVSTGTPGRVVLKERESWPALAYVPDAVSIEFDAGYGDDADSVQDATKAAMLLMIGHWYKFREHGMAVVINTVPFTTEALLACEEWGHYG